MADPTYLDPQAAKDSYYQSQRLPLDQSSASPAVQAEVSAALAAQRDAQTAGDAGAGATQDGQVPPPAPSDGAAPDPALLDVQTGTTVPPLPPVRRYQDVLQGTITDAAQAAQGQGQADPAEFPEATAQGYRVTPPNSVQTGTTVPPLPAARKYQVIPDSATVPTVAPSSNGLLIGLAVGGGVALFTLLAWAAWRPKRRGRR